MTPLSTASSRPARTTIRDVARLAGVGIKTVSRVINAEPNVSSDTTERVRRAIAALNYIPDSAAGSLRRSDRSTRTLGLLVADTTDPFFAQINRAVEDAATARGFAVFTSSSDEQEGAERAAIGAFLHRRVDGLVLAATAANQIQLAAEQERGTPVAFVDRVPHGITGDAIITDNAAATARSVQHLVRHGHRRVAGLFDAPGIWTTDDRMRGFSDAVSRAGVEAGSSVVTGVGDEERAMRAVVELLRLDRPPTALFTGRSTITIGAIRALRHVGKLWDVAVVGFDDFETADLLEPAVTVVAQRASQMGRLAVGRVFARIDGVAGPFETVVVPSDLVARGSGEIPPGAE